jgi:hypothetical protein
VTRGRLQGPAVIALLALAIGLAACSEKPQTATARKADAAPSQGAAAAYTVQGWKAGDATSWDTHIKARTQGQNEYTRTGGH